MNPSTYHSFKSITMTDQTNAGMSSIHLDMKTCQSNSATAWPMADEALTQSLLDLVQQSSHYRQLKKGANEGIPLQFQSTFNTHIE